MTGKNLQLVATFLITSLMFGCGGGGGSGDSAISTSGGSNNPGLNPGSVPVIKPLPTVETTPPGSGISTTVNTAYTVLAWNDLGMHCLNPSYDIGVILPP